MCPICTLRNSCYSTDMISDFIKLCCEQHSRSKENLEKAEKDCVKAQEVVNSWRQTVRDLRNIIQLAKLRGEEIPDTYMPDTHIDSNIPLQGDRDPKNISNKEYVRGVVERSDGVTPRDIIEAAVKDGRGVNTNSFPYESLRNMRHRGEIFKQGTKFYKS